LRFGADPRTNSILIPATTEDLSRILELISRLDANAEIVLAPCGGHSPRRGHPAVKPRTGLAAYCTTNEP